MVHTEAAKRIIVALDVPDRTTARRLGVTLRSAGAKMVKIGSQLFTAAGPEVVYDMRALHRARRGQDADSRLPSG